MKGRTSFSELYLKLTADQRVTAWHVSLYVAMLYLWQLGENQNPVSVTRKRLMQLARMRSCMTYHKCMSQLQDFGFITYIPSFHSVKGSDVHLKI